MVAANLQGGGVDLSFHGSAFPRATEVREKLYSEGSVGISGRYARLERLDAFYRCREYDHQKIGWDGLLADDYETISPNVATPAGFTQPAQETPNEKVRKKRPTAPLRLNRMVVDRYTGLLFSQDRTPRVTVEGDEESDDFLRAVWKKARFWRTMHQARTQGGSMGSTLVTVQLRNGRFSYTAHSPKTIHDIVWEDPDLRIPAGVLIQYKYIEEYEERDSKTGAPNGKMRQVEYVYRRIIDEEWDVLFKPVQIGKDGRIPPMEVDLDKTYQHRLMQFPGAFIQNLPSDEFLDGAPDSEGAFQLFDTIDRQLSQSNKGLLQNQDPSLVLSRDKKLSAEGAPIFKGSENALEVGIGGSAQYLEIGGSGITAAIEYIKLLRQSAMDLTQCVLVDPTAISGAAQSAKAIEYIYGPMLEKGGRLREQYGEAIETLADITLLAARVWSDPKLYVGRVKGTTFGVPPKVVEDDADPDNPDPTVGRVIRLVPRRPGPGGIVSLEWGAFFSETPADIQMAVSTIATVYGAGLMDQETAVRKIAIVFDIEDVDGLLRRVREENEKKTKEQETQMASLFPGAAPMGGEVPPGLPDEGFGSDRGF